ncbi:MAG TPA: hypothetical protein VF737_13970 [Gemmatimonadaceae bacterium]|jgi:hypothetical protein
MRSALGRQSVGLIGTLFVSACCLGAAPIVIAAASVVGLGAVRHAMNVYVLGPLMTLSVLWIGWNLAVQGRALAGRASRYAVFWAGIVGGTLAWAGVLLPHIVRGTGRPADVLIVVGMVTLIGASLKGVMGQRGVR